MSGRTLAGMTVMAVLSVLVLSGRALADGSHEHIAPVNFSLLERMSHALQHLDYKGTFVYLHGGEVETMRIIHRAGARGSEQKLRFLSGPAREVIRRNSTIQCILPSKELVLVSEYHSRSSFPVLLPKGTDAAALKKHYELQRVGEQRIAGHPCVVIAVKPKDQYRYGYRLWLDKKTHLLLRSELVSTAGEMLERVMFTNITAPADIAPKALKPTIDVSGFTRISGSGMVSEVKQPKVEVTVTVSDVPPGYRLMVNEMQRLHKTGELVRHMVFSDGLASLSIFAAPYRHDETVLHGLSQRGAVNAYGRVVNGYQITVVGEVPAKTVRMVAESVVVK